MLRIGEFSKICQVSVKALRHWDAIGLLNPTVIDPVTSYRYYSINQVGDVNRVMALKAMGLGLAQISDMMQSPSSLTTDDIRAMLRLKQVELHQQITDAADMLMLIESRLKQIDNAGTLPDYEVVLKSAEARLVLAVREVVPDMERLVALLAETHPYARQREGTNLLAVFHDDAYELEQIDVEVAFPVESASVKPIPLANSRQMQVTQLPGIELLASTVHHGEWLSLSQAYIHLGGWIETNNYQIVGAGREIFHHIDWHGEQKATVTELQFPVVKRTAV